MPPVRVTHFEGYRDAVNSSVNLTKQTLDTGVFAHRSEFVPHRDHVLSTVSLLAGQHNQNYQGVLSILAQITSNTQRIVDELRGDCTKQIEALARLLPTDTMQETVVANDFKR